MMIKQETMPVKGWVNFEVISENGVILHAVSAPNLVVNQGQDLIAGLIAGLAVDPPSHMAVGSSSVAPAKTQTDLLGVEYERVVADVSVEGNTINILAQFGAGIVTPVLVGEFAIFNGEDDSSQMLARFTTSLFTLAETSIINISWRLTIGG